MSEWKSGQVILGEYTIEKELGRGGTAGQMKGKALTFEEHDTFPFGRLGVHSQRHYRCKTGGTSLRDNHGDIPRCILSAARIRIDPVGAAMVAGMLQSETRHQRICHFMKSEHCSSLLSSSRLWLRRSDLFEDEEEGLFAKSPLTDPLRSAFPGVILESSEVELREQQRLDCMTRFIHCWFASEPETKKMWQDYGDEGRGVCLLSSTAQLLSALQPVEHMSYGLHAVTYMDSNNAVMELHSSLPYCRKRTKYANEKEVRLLATMALEHTYLNQGALPDGEWPNHMLVDVDLGLMLEGIELGASMEKEDVRKIREQAGLSVPGIGITHSRVAVCEQGQDDSRAEAPR